MSRSLSPRPCALPPDPGRVLTKEPQAFSSLELQPLPSLSQANIGHMDTPKELWRMITGNMALIQVRKQRLERVG